MAPLCTGSIRFFLHTFLFVKNHSFSLHTTAENGDMNNDSSVVHYTTQEDDMAPRRPYPSESLHNALECMQVYIVPVFIAVGVAGSVLGIVVLLGTHLRYKFFSHFLVCLNVSSASFLLTVFTSWLADTGVDVFWLPGLCQLHIFSSHFFTFLAVWISVLGAYLVLWDWIRPREVPWLNSPTAAKVAVLALAVLTFTVYSYKSWTHFSLVHRGSRVCTVIPENERAMQVLNALDVLVLLVLPSFFFIVFVFIVLFRRLRPYCRGVKRLGCRKVSVKGRERVIYTCPSGDVITELGGLRLVRRDAVPRLREVHRLVLSQAACFLLLVTPRAVSGLLVLVLRFGYGLQPREHDILLNQVFQVTFYLYFTVLPLCPVVSSSKFRLHCWALLSSRPKNRTPVIQVEGP